MIPGAVHRSPGICIAAEKTPPKTSTRRLSDEGTNATSRRLKWGPFPLNEIGAIAQHVRKGDGRKEGKDGIVVNKVPND
jgi:hypothetical protein